MADATSRNSSTSIEKAAAEGEAMRAWLVENLLRIKTVFGPLLRDAVAAGVRASDAVQKEGSVAS